MEEKDLLKENREIIDANVFPGKCGVVISKIREDYAEGYVDISDDSMNSYGAVHGGVYFTLADATAAFAARSNGKTYVTQSCSMNFIRGTKEGRIRCQSNVVNRGRKFCILNSKIFDDNDKLVFDGNFTYFCVE